MNVKKTLSKFNIVPDPLKDQFFLLDEKVIGKMIDLAELGKDDVVLEVGVGIGNLTKELAKRAGKVIAFEIDPRFKPLLSGLPSNVELRFEDAWDFVQLHGKFRKRKVYNKVVSSLPYSFCEPFLHNLTFLDYDKVILLVPQKFSDKIEKNPVFGSFFKVRQKLVVEKSKFYPIPRTDSVIIDLVKLPDPIGERNLPLFLRQYMYQHESQETKNSLMEGLIQFARLVYCKKLTKNQTREIITRKGIDRALLESPPNNPEIYSQVSNKFQDVSLG